MVHRLKPPNMIERGRLQWPVHRIRDWKTLLQIPALPFTSCEVLGKSLTSQIMIILIIIHKCYITIKSHINITANGVTEKVVKKKKKTSKSIPSISLQEIMCYKYEVYYVYALIIWVKVYRERLIITRIILSFVSYNKKDSLIYCNHYL